MKSVILTYHSHHVLRPQYDLNDHIALPLDLEVITRAGYRIVPLERIVDVLEAEGERRAVADRPPYVALTFDDGPVWDLDDFIHPQMGLQRGFVGVLRDFSDTALGRMQPELHATSFVIASPEARTIMETTFDPDYTYLGPGAMGEEWWARAIATGLLAIANHSWDHLHPALAQVAHSTQARADFTQVLSVADADAQIFAASRYIGERTQGRAAPYFAYPFGHVNSFLAADYLPARGGAVGVRAAFTTEPRAVARDDDRFRLPRYVCGQDWKSPQKLAAILAAA